MSLLVKAADVPVRVSRPIRGSGEKEVSRVYGKEANVSPCRYRSGYHTKPHYHAAEQINYVLEGEIWFFVEARAYRCEPGDFMRIPRNRTHWAWNRSGADAVVIEVHAPPLIGGAVADHTVGLFDDGESHEVPVVAENLFDREFDPTTAELGLPD